MNNIFLKEHDEMVPFFKTASQNIDYVLINVDAHSDMHLPDPRSGSRGRYSGIGDFILFAVKEKYFSKILWIKDDGSDDFEDGFYEFNIFWQSETSSWKCDLEHLHFFNTDEYSKNAASIFETESPDLIKVQLEVISEKNLSKSRFAGLNWVLSLDCDFFSAANPHKAQYEKALSEAGGSLERSELDKLKNKMKAIKTYDEWNSFKKELVISKKWLPLNTILPLDFIETNYGDQEAESKMLNILKFLKNNFAKEKCLSALTCLSFFSGYTRRDRCPEIVSMIDTVFENFDFFWEKV